MTVQEKLEQVVNEQTELRAVVTERFKGMDARLKDQGEATAAIQKSVQSLNLAVGQLVTRFDERMVPGEAAPCALHEEKLVNLSKSINQVKKKSEDNERIIGRIDKKLGIIVAIPVVFAFIFLCIRTYIYVHEKVG